MQFCKKMFFLFIMKNIKTKKNIIQQPTTGHYSLLVWGFFHDIFKCQFLLPTYSKEMHISTGFLKINMPIQNTKRLIKSYPKKITALKIFFPQHINFRSQMS